METPFRRRRALSTALALVLAIESVAAVAVVAASTRDTDGSRHALPAAAPQGVVYAEQGAAEPAGVEVAPAAVIPAAAVAGPASTPDVPDSAAQGAARSEAAAAPTRTFAPKDAPGSIKKPKADVAGSSSGGAVSSGSLKGRNHFWFPAIGINRAVYSFPCSRSRAPDNLVYRWGCAGANNVYLLGHADSVFKPLHDAYVSGRLKAGMKAYYADSRGKVHTYVVKWWKLTRPTTSASWAWAAQSVPSMTLQTCVGSNSEYRVMVRLVEVR